MTSVVSCDTTRRHFRVAFFDCGVVFGSIMKLHLLLAVILCLLLVANAEEDDDEGEHLLSLSVFLFWLRNKVGLVYYVYLF